MLPCSWTRWTIVRGSIMKRYALKALQARSRPLPATQSHGTWLYSGTLEGPFQTQLGWLCFWKRLHKYIDLLGVSPSPANSTSRVYCVGLQDWRFWDHSKNHSMRGNRYIENITWRHFMQTRSWRWYRRSRWRTIWRRAFSIHARSQGWPQEGTIHRQSCSNSAASRQRSRSLQSLQ
jgi:hypothetical protein